MVEYTDDINVWKIAEETECPFLRFLCVSSKWVALGEDPCPTKKCRNKKCHNYGKPFHSQDRLIIVRVKVDK